MASPEKGPSAEKADSVCAVVRSRAQHTTRTDCIDRMVATHLKVVHHHRTLPPPSRQPLNNPLQRSRASLKKHLSKCHSPVSQKLKPEKKTRRKPTGHRNEGIETEDACTLGGAVMKRANDCPGVHFWILVHLRASSSKQK